MSIEVLICSRLESKFNFRGFLVVHKKKLSRMEEQISIMAGYEDVAMYREVG